METKKSKYDTNPLDPDFVRDTEKVWGTEEGGSETHPLPGATRPVSPRPDDARSNVYSEAPTRTFDNSSPDAPYQSVFVPPTYSPPMRAPQVPPAAYQQPLGTGAPSSRTVAGISLPEKWAVVLPYAPFYIGVVVSLLELFLVPRKEVKVRFHAAQGLSLQIGILAIRTLFGILGAISGSSIGGTLFGLAAMIFLVVSMIRVSKGRPHRIAPLAEPCQWFNEHIEPRKSS